MYQLIASLEVRDDSYDFHVFETADKTDTERPTFRYEERLRTAEGAEAPGCPMSALSQLEDFLARAKHALEGVS